MRPWFRSGRSVRAVSRSVVSVVFAVASVVLSVSRAVTLVINSCFSFANDATLVSIRPIRSGRVTFRRQRGFRRGERGLVGFQGCDLGDQFLLFIRERCDLGFDQADQLGPCHVPSSAWFSPWRAWSCRFPGL